MKLNRPSLQNLIGKEKLIGAEIGVYKGHNAKDMLEKLDIEKLYLIDVFNKKYASKKTVDKHLSEYSGKLIWLIGRSEIVANDIEDESLDFGYVDGGHKKPQVLKDLQAYYPKIKPGGLICGHDYQENIKLGVYAAVNEFFNDKKIFFAPCLDSIKSEDRKHMDWWVWKDE